uniref:CACN subunit beta associated regulatory protein n=1 Tax=Amazona collaria TaxID=241587 RepID=A0A8B9G3B2_9PSIT
MSDDPTPWDNATESATVSRAALPVSPQDGYVLLLALLSIFIGGTLVLLSSILIICRRCCEADRRASDDPEKTNTTYLEDSQPAQGDYRDAESERFLSSSSSTARRVSFNEAALFEQGKKTQEKGRRYTLTEGDFHHLKNARLTHLHLPPPALKIVTIHECESSENSLAMTPRLPPAKPGLAIFQPVLPSHAVCPSSALPGDTYNSSADTGFAQGSPAASSDSGEGPSLAAAPRSGKGAGTGSATPGEPSPAPVQGTVLQFFTRLRRHASLDGASPYFKIKKWKLESTQRASSLDTRGSPKRRQFQRQRAASESMDQEDRDPHQTDIIQYIARTDDVAFHPAGGPFLPSPASPPPSLGRYFSVDRGDREGGGAAKAPGGPQALGGSHLHAALVWGARGGGGTSTRRRMRCSTPSCATTLSSTSPRCGASTAPALTCASSGSTRSSTATPACATRRWSGTAPRCAAATAPTTRWTPASTAPCPASSAPATRRRRRRPTGSPPPRRCPTPRSR